MKTFGSNILFVMEMKAISRSCTLPFQSTSWTWVHLVFKVDNFGPLFLNKLLHILQQTAFVKRWKYPNLGLGSVSSSPFSSLQHSDCLVWLIPSCSCTCSRLRGWEKFRNSVGNRRMRGGGAFGGGLLEILRWGEGQKPLLVFGLPTNLSHWEPKKNKCNQNYQSDCKV